MNVMRKGFLAGVMLFGVASTAAVADVFTAEAFNNSTIQPAGPRTGSNNLAFFNIEGSANGTFASYGVADFDGDNFGVTTPVVDIVSAKLKLAQSNASFTNNGAVDLFLSKDTATIISNTGGSPLTFQNANLPNGLGTQLNPKGLIASGVFTEVANGDLDEYVLNLSAVIDGMTVESILIAALNGGGNIRLIVAPADANVAATYAGYTNFTYAGPTLGIEALVPEPVSASLLGLGLAILGARRRGA